MDLDIVVFWLALTIVASGLLSTRGRGGWAAVTAAILVAAPILLHVAPESAPWIVFGLVAVFVVLPGLLIRATVVFNRRQNYRAARLTALGVAILHPIDDWPASVRLFGALDLLGRGEDQAARVRLQRLAEAPTEIGLAAKSRLLRLDSDWSAVLQDPRLAGENVSVLLLRLRALGETGRTAEMLELFRRVEPTLRRFGRTFLGQALLTVAAFGGRQHAVAALIAGSFADSPEDHKRLWTATAQMTAGGSAQAEGVAAMQALGERAEPETRRVALLRLARPPSGTDGLGAEHTALLDRIETELSCAPRKLRPRMSRNVVTLLLGAANVAVFVLEWLSGGAEDDETLYTLGALFAPAVVQGGEWWRLLTAMFLHAGWLHLAANMLGLLIIGSVVEPLYGRWKYSLLYFGAGLGSMASIVVFSHAGWMRPSLLVGASGAIMGLIGALGAAALRQWLRSPSMLARQRLARVALALVLQSGIDLTTPRISFAAHISGVGFGFVIGWSMRVGWTASDTDGALGPVAATPGDGILSARQVVVYAIIGLSVGVSLWVAAYR